MTQEVRDVERKDAQCPAMRANSTDGVGRPVDRVSRYAGPLAILFVAILAYVNSLANRFALDDVFIIQVNPRIHDFANQAAIWLTPYWPSYGEELGLYRPLAIFAYAAQWALADGAPWIFHATSVAMHACASVLVFIFLRRLLPTLPGTTLEETGDGVVTAGALLGGLAFAVHPAHSEAVANLVGQAELIAAITTLAACHLHATRAAGPDVDWPRRIALVVLFLIGCLAKESAIVLPALLVVVDAAQGRWTYSVSSIRLYTRGMAVPLFLVAAAAIGYLALRVDVLGSIGGAYAAPSLPFLRGEHRVLMAFRAWPEYVRLMVFPLDLSADYSPAVILPVEGLTPMAVLGAVLLGVTTVLAILTPRVPRAGLPAAWFLISILPVSNLLLPIGVVVAERLLYTPSVALSFIVAFGWQRFATSAPARTRRLAIAAAAIVLFAGGVRTIIRNPEWKDTAAVWDALVRDHPESYRSQLINVARALERGNRNLARDYLEIAYRLWPNDPMSLYQLAQFEIEEGNHRRAVELLERARDIAPYVSTYDVSIGYAHLALDEPHEALEALERAVRRDAPRTITHALRAQAYARLGRHAEAAGAWRAAVRTPGTGLWNFYALLARELARAGATDQARAAADTAISAASSETRPIVDALRAAIDRGCYDAGASTDSKTAAAGASSCDPLASWGVVVPVTRSENARTLQNAMREPAAGSGSEQRR